MIEFIPFLSTNRLFFLALHLLAFALGLGSALLSDLFLIRFIRGGNLTQKEVDVLRIFTQVIWSALILFAISGTVLVLPRAETFLNSPKFQVKILAVLVIVINGILLNTLVAPKLIKVFGEKYSKKNRFLRRLAFGFGAVSITSWFTAFLLSVFRTLQINFLPLLAVYLGVLLFNILVSQILEFRLSKKSWPF